MNWVRATHAKGGDLGYCEKTELEIGRPNTSRLRLPVCPWRFFKCEGGIWREKAFWITGK